MSLVKVLRPWLAADGRDHKELRYCWAEVDFDIHEQHRVVSTQKGLSLGPQSRYQHRERMRSLSAEMRTQKDSDAADNFP